MEENNNLNYECEPVRESVQEPVREPVQEPVYTPYYQPNTQKPKKEKKNHTTAKMVALITVVALVASIGGSVLTTAISSIINVSPAFFTNDCAGELTDCTGFKSLRTGLFGSRLKTAHAARTSRTTSAINHLDFNSFFKIISG